MMPDTIKLFAFETDGTENMELRPWEEERSPKAADMDGDGT